MMLTINGQSRENSATQSTIAAILKENNVENPAMVSVQLNGSFVEPQHYETTSITSGDEIEFLYFMGGGR